MTQQYKVSGRNTCIFTEEGMTKVKYHWTDVVAFNHKTIQLDSNGWRTSTTKTRMNQASNQFGLGYYVRQKDFDWFVEYNGETLPFYDGIKLKRAEA